MTLFIILLGAAVVCSPGPGAYAGNNGPVMHPHQSGESGQEPVDELFGYYVVRRPGVEELKVVKGINRLEPGDEVLGGPFSLTDAQAFKKQRTGMTDTDVTVVDRSGGPVQPAEPDVVLHLSLDAVVDGKIQDRSQSSFTAVVHGDPLLVDTPNGRGLQFDGRDDWLLLPADPYLDIHGSMTLMVMMKIPESARSEGLHMIVWHGDERGGRDPYSFFISSGRILFRRDFPKTVMVGWSLWNLDFDRYHVFCGVHRRHEDIFEIWVDGELAESIKGSGKISYDTKRMTTQIGAMESGRSQHFTGILDDVKIFQRALTPDELRRESLALLGR
ncbi:MAG: LamG domain-containing protein [Acidobacteria bacterium]|nr:LamG domain-containing protein [Acidobacteriota bacterium]